MWTCSELKRRAKAVLSRTYWNSFVAVIISVAVFLGVTLVLGVVCVVLTMAGLLVSGNGFDFVLKNGISGNFYYHFSQIPSALIPSVISIYVLSIACSLLILMPIKNGVYNFFLNGRAASERSDYSCIFFAFRGGNYPKIIGAILWGFLWGAIFSLPMTVCDIALSVLPQIVTSFYLRTFFFVFFILLIIPAAVLSIYKSICYSMLPFILCDNPKIGFRRALRLSITMTRGHVGKIFLLGLSFIGWVLLGALALGIGVLFVIPYIAATFTELYAQLRDNVLKSGECAYSELNFATPSGGTAEAN